MTGPAEPFETPETSKEEIYRATYRAIVEHGYMELSIQHIADEASLSKSTIYHHFENREKLIMAFAEELLEWYSDRILFDSGGDPVENLERTFDLFFLEETADGLQLEDVLPTGITSVYLGLRMEATENPAVRDYFDAMDAMMREDFAALVENGVEAGTLRDVDPDHVGAFLFTFMEGALLVRSTESDRTWLRHARAILDDYLDTLKVESVDGR
jgi:AcrR family transcriptional regulator